MAENLILYWSEALSGDRFRTKPVPDMVTGAGVTKFCKVGNRRVGELDYELVRFDHHYLRGWLESHLAAFGEAKIEEIYQILTREAKNRKLKNGQS